MQKLMDGLTIDLQALRFSVHNRKCRSGWIKFVFLSLCVCVPKSVCVCVCVCVGGWMLYVVDVVCCGCFLSKMPNVLTNL